MISEKSLTPNPSPKGEGSRMKSEQRKIIKDIKGFGALRLKLYLELSFRILKKIFVSILNFISSRRRPKVPPNPPLHRARGVKNEKSAGDVLDAFHALELLDKELELVEVVDLNGEVA